MQEPKRARRRPDNLVSFPPAQNVKLIEELVETFLALPGGPGSLRYFRRSILGNLARRRRALGFPAKIVNAEMKEIESAMARLIWERDAKKEGTA